MIQQINNIPTNKLPVNSLVNYNNNIGIVKGIIVDSFGYMMQRIKYNSVFINYHIIQNGKLLKYNKQNIDYIGFVLIGEYTR